jgi:hypothetical protein
MDRMARNRWNQAMPDANWALVRGKFPGRSAVCVVDEDACRFEFLLLDPAPDCSDLALDGTTLHAADAEAALKGQASEPLPRHLQEEITPPWASR